MLTIVQEKKENLITLPESSDAVRTLLGFCYSGEYEELDKDESEGCKALHHAEVYVAAKKYQIDNLVARAGSWLEQELKVCQERLVQCDCDATQPEEAPKDHPHRISFESFEDLLDAISIILEGTPEDDGIRTLILLNWSRFKATGDYRAPWLELLRKHPGYAADVMEVQGDRESKPFGKMDKLKARHKRDISARKDKLRTEMRGSADAIQWLKDNHRNALALANANLDRERRKPCPTYEEALNVFSADASSTNQWLQDRVNTMVQNRTYNDAEIKEIDCALAVISAHRTNYSAAPGGR